MACAICEAATEQTLCDRCNAVAKAFNYDPVRIAKRQPFWKSMKG